MIKSAMTKKIIEHFELEDTELLIYESITEDTR